MEEGLVFLHPAYSSQQVLWSSKEEFDRVQKVGGWKFWKRIKNYSEKVLMELFLFSMHKREKYKRNAEHCLKCDLYVILGSLK